jgi:hypothetical protein
MKKSMVFFLCTMILFLGTTLAQERKLQKRTLITITSPKEGQNFKITDPIPVSWNSIGITGQLKGSLHKYQQGEVETYGNNLNPSGSLTIPAGRITPGRYFIRLEEINGDAKADSGIFSVLPKLDKPEMVKRQPQNIEVTIPAQKRDRHSKRDRRSPGNNFLPGGNIPTDPTHLSNPGQARVGFENHLWKDDDDWVYRGFIYRSRLFFDVSQFVGKKGILLEAKLILNRQSTDSNYPDVNFCGQDLHVLTGVWELPVRCIETPGYHYKRIHANATQSIDIVQQVRDWISGAETNHGLLFTGVNERWEHNNLKCVSYYTAELYIKFREHF